MTRHNRDLLARWLTAEASESEARAEAALTALLEWLPDEAPSAAFTRNVLTRLREEPGTARRWTWLLRVAAVLGIVLVGGSVVAAPSVLLALPVSVGNLIALVADGVAVLVTWLGHALSLWEGMARIAQKVGLVLATPEATLFMLGTSAAGALAFRLLYGLAMQDRRWHVDSV